MDDTTNPDETSQFGATLRLNNVFDALAHPRRRYLLYTLGEEKEEWTLRGLARYVAAWETDEVPAQIPEETVDRTYISLYHTHVPKLVEKDIVSFEATSETIRPGSNAEQILTVLEQAGGVRDSRQEAHAHRNNDD